MSLARPASSCNSVTFVAVAAIAIALSGCENANTEPLDPAGMSALLVDVQIVEEAIEYRIQRDFIGRVEAARRSEVGFELAGELRDVYVDEGDVVSANDVLARLDTARLEARFAEARAALAQAASARDFAVRTYERRKEAALSGGISEQRVDEALDAANAARAGMDAAEARLNSVKVDLDKSRLVAPYDAIVVRRQVDEGNVVAAGYPVLHLQDLASPEVRIGVAGEIAATISPDDHYQVAIGSQLIDATVRAVLPVRDAATRTVDVILELDETGTAYPGDLARITVQQPISEPGYWLPVSALTEGSRGLWTANVVTPITSRSELENGATHIVEPRSVEVLYKQTDRVFVRGALTDGDRFVVSGTQRIVPYQQVRVGNALAKSATWSVAHE